jgi:hypothetical protein
LRAYVRVHHVGLLALFVALGGTSYAAVKLPAGSVGPTQIAANAVTSAKVKNGSLLARDFRQGQLPSGVAGPAGPAGAKGDPGTPGQDGVAGRDGATGHDGATGARGPSDVYQASDGSTVDWTSSFTTQRSLNLPAGTFVVTATGVANSNGSAMESVDCRLLVGGTNVDQATDLFLGASATPGEKVPISLTGAITLAAPAPAELQCESTGIGNVIYPSITAVEVGTVHQAP